MEKEQQLDDSERLETEKRMIEMGTWYEPLTKETPVSHVLSAVLFVTLPFLGFWLGVVYNNGENLYLFHTGSLVEATPQFRSVPEREDDAQSPTVLALYLSPYLPSEAEYSGLADEELAQVNEIIELAASDGDVAEAQQENASSVFDTLFGSYEVDRVQDAPSLRANALIYSKLCVAKTIVLQRQADAVLDCVGVDIYPDDVEWSTDDLMAEAQVAPYYLAGSYYYDQGTDVERANYYLTQVVRHYEVAIDEWGELEGEEYLAMVADARAKIEEITRLQDRMTGLDEYANDLPETTFALCEEGRHPRFVVSESDGRDVVYTGEATLFGRVSIEAGSVVFRPENMVDLPSCARLGFVLVDDLNTRASIDIAQQLNMEEVLRNKPSCEYDNDPTADGYYALDVRGFALSEVHLEKYDPTRMLSKLELEGYRFDVEVAGVAKEYAPLSWSCDIMLY